MQDKLKALGLIFLMLFGLLVFLIVLDAIFLMPHRTAKRETFQTMVGDLINCRRDSSGDDLCMHVFSTNSLELARGLRVLPAHVDAVNYEYLGIEGPSVATLGRDAHITLEKNGRVTWSVPVEAWQQELSIVLNGQELTIPGTYNPGTQCFTSQKRQLRQTWCKNEPFFDQVIAPALSLTATHVEGVLLER